jgi:hypothetical protein
LQKLKENALDPYPVPVPNHQLPLWKREVIAFSLTPIPDPIAIAVAVAVAVAVAIAV